MRTILILSLALLSCGSPDAPGTQPAKQKERTVKPAEVEFVTSDGVTVWADLYEVAAPRD